MHRLIHCGRDDADIIAIMITESYFRPAHLRLLEFACYVVLRLVKHPYSSRISLGIGQLQVRHFLRPPRIEDCFSYTTAYDALVHHHTLNGTISAPLQRKVAIHVGEVRGFYMRIAYTCHDQIAEAASTIRLEARELRARSTE